MIESLPSSLRFVGSSTSQRNPNNNRNEDGRDHSNSPNHMQIDPQRTPDSPSSSDRAPHSDDTNKNRFQTAQPGIPSTHLPMAPAARAQWNQLADIFELDSKYRAEALRISSITGTENQYHTLVCLLQKTRQDMDNVASQLRSAAGWKPAADLGTRLTKIIRETLQDHTIESYTLKVDSNKKPIARSFDKKAMNAIMKQSDSWKLENLPSDFGTSLTDLKKHEAFMKFFGAKIRHVRDDFRVVLLTNILVPHAKVNEPLQPVPKLSELQLLASLNLFAVSHLLVMQLHRTSLIMEHVTKEINTTLDSKAQARFAYLAVKYHFASQEERKLRPGQSHWAWADHQLATLRGENRNDTRAYRRAFDTIILATDQGFFDGKKTIDKIKADEKFRIPTDADISQAIDFMSSNTN
ncbi:uncharacterized protein MELLADRAFT_87626 [Melampsora larici-populina 98AG31]|uniref:Uncharacterized protein n=1 Tax=Melampsora larici-populina (strain 98AG31 / pathotype 3-4-7) TaxID=747676 RepID=F4RP41_MELLP|nr:uncharacterized protein MELLADRAFT_87626 [Melampsora larici-populina 98AG31]EGG05918.1 hypothetical protein MELLADRAFT_87626 [Melampsora larici-populina 98AG31]